MVWGWESIQQVQGVVRVTDIPVAHEPSAATSISLCCLQAAWRR